MRGFAGLLLVLLMSAPVAVWADMRIGFVNAERVMRESAPAARALKKLKNNMKL